MRILSLDWDWELRLGDWKLGLGCRIRDLNLGFVIENKDG